MQLKLILESNPPIHADLNWEEFIKDTPESQAQTLLTMFNLIKGYATPCVTAS